MLAVNADYLIWRLIELLLCDLKDAIGAIGIARCFTFGGHKKRPLYDPEVRPATELTKEQYMEQGRNATTINHFYEVRAGYGVVDQQTPEVLIVACA